MTIVPIPGQPGESIDARILRDVEWIIRTFKVKVTDGYSTSSVHSSSGEHPVGLAVDVVPDFERGGTWDDVDRLMAWAEPKQGQPRAPFRWVGYNGDPNHGRGNHGHLSWVGRNAPLERIFGRGGTLTATGKVATEGTDFGLPGVLGDAQEAAIAGAGAIGGAALGGAGAVLPEGFKQVWGLFSGEAARIALWVALIVAGVALVLVGVGRASGVGGSPSASAPERRSRVLAGAETAAEFFPAGRAARAAKTTKGAKAA